MNPYVEIIRPVNGVMAMIAVAVGFFVAAGQFALPQGLFFAMASAFLILSAGMAINDYYDYPIDRKTKKQRPIPSGRMGLGAAWRYSAVLFVAGLGLAFLVNIEAFAIAVVAAATLFLYAKELSKKAFTGNFLVALNTALTFVFGAAVVGVVFSVEVLALAGMALFATLAREIYGSIRDMKADKGTRETLPMKIGASKSIMIAAFSMGTAIMLSPIPYWAGVFGGTYLLLVALVDAGFLYVVLNSFKTKNFAREAHYCRVFQMAALIAFLAGAL
ncbi:MAG: UbiA family prenyltransferase [Candidatus Diapherotrites archaeon]|nr:UbiA family prenyltransferase [Candidatus Diapherotrites archaeon]